METNNAPASRTVLVVDDEPDIRHLLRAILESAGYAVVEAAQGEAALDEVQRAPPHLIVTDRMMPRMNGDNLIARLRAENGTKAIPIVMITGTRGGDGGADVVLEKPFRPSDLIAVVDQLTGMER